MTDASTKIDRRDAALLVLLSVLWGGGFILSGLALRDVPPLTLVFARVAIGALFLLPVVLVSRVALPSTPRGWMPFLVMGLLNNVIPFTLLAAGQTQITTGLVSIVNATAPLFSVIVTAAFREEVLTAHKIGGVIMGLIGVIILRGHDADLSSTQTFGILLCLGAALSYAFSGVWARRKLRNVPPLVSAIGQLSCSSIVLAVLAAAIDRPWTGASPSLTTWLALLGVGTFATAIAYLVFFRILARSGATNAMLVTLLIPITTIVLAHFILGETIGLRDVTGALVIGGALLIIDGRILAWLAARLRAVTSAP